MKMTKAHLAPNRMSSRLLEEMNARQIRDNINNDTIAHTCVWCL